MVRRPKRPSRSWWSSGLALAIVASAACRIPPPDPPEAPPLAPRSGSAFQSADTRALQDDAFANPGLLWRDRGEALFDTRAGASGRSCRDCHADGLVASATRFPRVDPERGGLVNLEMAIRDCRSDRQHAQPLAWESDELLALTTFVASRSNGLPYDVEVTGAAAEHWRRGRDYFYTRVGQLNLACHHCHERNVGKRLRGDTISQGQPVGYPAYRFEWQAVGSLHRRLQFCNAGVRAAPKPHGDPTYLSLELYLAWRAGDLAFETPAVRR